MYTFVTLLGRKISVASQIALSSLLLYALVSAGSYTPCLISCANFLGHPTTFVVPLFLEPVYKTNVYVTLYLNGFSILVYLSAVRCSEL